MVSKEKKIFHYDIYEDNGIDGTTSLGESKYRRQGNCKGATSKKEREKHHNAPILHYKKNGQK
jgi:hypothetical protein